jgi:hypothetical protein
MRTMLLFWLGMLVAQAQIVPAPKPIQHAAPQVKGAERQLISVAVVVIPTPKITIAWDYPQPIPGLSFNVYHKLAYQLPMTLLTNTPNLSITLSADKPQEYFGVRAIAPGYAESNWATK